MSIEEASDHHRDVVRTTRLIGRGDQPLAHFLSAASVLKQSEQILIPHMAGQAIGTKQEAVADVQGGLVDFHAQLTRIAAETAPEDITPAGLLCFLRSQDALLD